MGHITISTKGVQFFTDHYLRVCAAREKKGLLLREDFMLPNHGEVKDSPLLGKEFMSNGSLYKVDQVYRQWYMGWHTRIFSLVNGSKSHGEHITEADGCQCKIYTESAKDFEKALFL